MPRRQTSEPEQSLETMHSGSAHASPAQSPLPGQLAVSAAGQVPAPLQLAGKVTVPPVHSPARHSVSPPGKLQLVRALPSQVPAQSPEPPQAARGGSGSPKTAEQVPSRPLRLQASHWPVHEVSQQTPSTQAPLAHWPLPVQASPRP